MSVNSKMTAIADNIRDKTGGTDLLTLDDMAEGVNEVFEAGKASMIDESKIIEKTVSGSIISVDDVSEVPHEVAIQLSSDTVTDFSGVTVKVCGKNLSGKAMIHKYDYSNDYKKYNAENAVILPKGTYFISASNLPALQFFDIETKKGLLVSEIASVGTTAYYANWDGYAFLPSGSTAMYNSFTLNKTAIVTMCGQYGEIANCQIEVGTYQTAYEAPMEPQTYTPNADGTVEGITSISPNMTVFTDNADVNISMDYHKSWGMQTEYDRFWDVFLNNGAPQAYPRAFCHTGWTNATFKPKHNIIVSGSAGNMFQMTGIQNLTEALQEQGVVLDTSQMTDGSYLFYSSNKTLTIPRISFESCTPLNNSFGWCTVRVLDELVLKEDGSNTFSSPFVGCTGLEEIRVRGVIGQNGLSFQNSTKLSKASITSIINALSSTTSGLTLTLSKTAVTNAFGSTTATEWTNLIATKSNWTISLA